MQRQLTIIFLTILTFSCFSQQTMDSLDIAKKERRIKLAEQHRIDLATDYENSVKLTGKIVDGLTTFMPESWTSIVIFAVSASDSVTYRGQKVIVVIPGRHSRQLQKETPYEFSLVKYNRYKREDFNWIQYKDSGYKKMYLIDDKNSVRQVDK
jgi:hypothetical protein